MKKFGFFLVLLLAASFCATAQTVPNSYTIDLARTFSKELFDRNGVPYLSPMVKAVNATSNARFYNSAYVPRKVKKPYFRIGLHGMTGFINPDDKSFSPEMPSEKFDYTKLSQFGDINLNIIDPSKSVVNIRDTAGLVNYLFKTLLYTGIETGQIQTPATASSILGKDTTHLRIDNNVLKSLAQTHPIYQFLPKSMQDTLVSIMGSVPSFYTLPAGGDINTIIAGVPQFEIGSLYGTELLLRFIPPVDLGTYIGDFAFWGIGIKHSLSQYFYEEYDDEESDYQGNSSTRRNAAPFDLAAQIVYQGTQLNNKIGVTNADLSATASIWSVNIHFSKTFEDIIDIYSGFSYNYLQINSKFKYFLPVETQYALGLLRGELSDPNDPNSVVVLPPEPPLYPGDTNPQTSKISLDNSNVQWTFGASKSIGPITIFLDYNVSQFNIISGGLEYVF